MIAKDLLHFSSAERDLLHAAACRELRIFREKLRDAERDFRDDDNPVESQSVAGEYAAIYLRKVTILRGVVRKLERRGI